MSWAQTLFLKKIIEGKKRFIANDSVLFIAESSPLTIKPKLDGVLRVKITARTTQARDAKVTITDSNGNTQSVEFDLTTTYNDYYYDFNVQKNIEYSINFGVKALGTGNVEYQSEAICGQVTDYNYFG